LLLASAAAAAAAAASRVSFTGEAKSAAATGLETMCSGSTTVEPLPCAAATSGALHCAHSAASAGATAPVASTEIGATAWLNEVMASQRRLVSWPVASMQNLSTAT